MVRTTATISFQSIIHRQATASFKEGHWYHHHCSGGSAGLFARQSVRRKGARPSAAKMPLSPHPFTECSPLQSVFYRRRELYSLGWSQSSQDLHDYLLASAPNGGFIALARDPGRLILLGKTSVLKPTILVYTAAGQLVESLPWEPSNRIVALGFSASEELVVVLDEGVVRRYTLLAPCPSNSGPSSSTDHDAVSSAGPIAATSNSYYVQYSLGQEATETGVVEAKIWEGGLVALTGAGRFVDFRFPAEASDDDGPGIWDDYNQPPAPQVLPAVSLPGGSSSTGPLLPTSWTFIPPTNSSSGILEVLLSPPRTQSPSSGSTSGSTPATTGSGPTAVHASTASGNTNESTGGTVLTLDAISGTKDMRLDRGPFSAILASPNGKLLALLTSSHTLWVVSADFQRSLSEFDITECEAFQEAQSSFASSRTTDKGLGNSGVRQIEWCGNNTVALAFESEVVMVGPFGDSLRYSYSGSMRLVPEVDGVRIISADKHELIQKAADCSVAVFQPGSPDAAAALLDASDDYSHRSAKADEAIRAIRKDLAQAVDTCVEAASYEWDVIWQRKVLKAAAFGKAFLDCSYDSSSFVDVSRKLRALNNVRSYEIGIPISYEQFEHSGPQKLLQRLTSRNHHLLSLRLASHLHQRADFILKHWAKAKIARSASSALRGADSRLEDELCDLIVERFESLGSSVSVSYSAIASSAFQSGRVRLATRLLDHEPRAVDQVPLLLKMGEDRLALQKSVQSGDTDLVYHVLLRLKDQLSRGDFFRVVQAPLSLSTSVNSDSNDAANPRSASYSVLALRLLEAYASTYDIEMLRDLYFTDDRRVEAAILSLRESSPNVVKGDTKEDRLSSEVVKKKEASKFFSEDRERSVEAKLVDESIRLLSFQQALEKEDGHRSQWTGLSLNDTIRDCLIKGKHGGQMAKRAEKLRSEFKLTEKRWWALKIDAYIRTRDWDAMWSFANSKRPPPLGFEPIIAKLLAAHCEKEAARYVPKIMTVGDRTDKNKLHALLARVPPQVAGPLHARMGEAS